MIAAVRSVEPSSTMTQRSGRLVCATTERIVRSINFSSFLAEVISTYLILIPKFTGGPHLLSNCFAVLETVSQHRAGGLRFRHHGSGGQVVVAVSFLATSRHRTTKQHSPRKCGSNTRCYVVRRPSLAAMTWPNFLDSPAGTGSGKFPLTDGAAVTWTRKLRALG